MKLEEKKYTEKEREFILSKVRGIPWSSISIVLKEFWSEEFKKVKK
jgi:hypothetical protein